MNLTEIFLLNNSSHFSCFWKVKNVTKNKKYQPFHRCNFKFKLNCTLFKTKTH